MNSNYVKVKTSRKKDNVKEDRAAKLGINTQSKNIAIND